MEEWGRGVQGELLMTGAFTSANTRMLGKRLFSSLLQTTRLDEISLFVRMAFNLQSVLKALLFSSGQPLSIKDIQSVFARFHEQSAKVKNPESNAVETEEGKKTTAAVEPEEVTEVDADDSALYNDVPDLVTAAQIREALDAVTEDLKTGNEVFLLQEGATGYRIVSHPRYARWVRALRNEPPPSKLSTSALETMAVVAYRQPVTRSEIEAVRGVSADAGLNKLLERELIYITGRADLPGRPLQYATTDAFLEFVGVKSLVELPASDVLSPRQIDEWLKNAMNPTTPGDAEMGLPLEEGEGESPMEDEAHIEGQEPAPEGETAISDEAAELETATPDFDKSGEASQAEAEAGEESPVADEEPVAVEGEIESEPESGAEPETQVDGEDQDADEPEKIV
jgi:segregation and condensation protein B